MSARSEASPAPEQPESDASKVSKDRDVTTWKEAPILYLKSFAIGAADVVPGVSGGTMALIFGIYSRLLNAIKSFNTEAVKAVLRFNVNSFFREIHWKFVLLLLSGIFTALIFFTRIVPLPQYMYTQPELIYGLFFGLIAGSVVLLVFTLEKVNIRALLSIVLGAGIGYWLVTLIPTDTPEHPLFIFLTGSIATSALVLPGVSGSFLLLIMRKYDTILGAIGNLGTVQTLEALYILIPFGLGAAFGLAAFSRGLSWLLKRHYTITLCLLIGFMAGSLYIIWPFQERDFIQKEERITVDAGSAAAEEARQNERNAKVPEVLVFDRIINPEAPADEQQAELILVKNKLISSRPFWPGDPQEDSRLSKGARSLYEAYGMMAAGLLAVLALGLFSRRA